MRHDHTVTNADRLPFRAVSAVLVVLFLVALPHAWHLPPWAIGALAAGLLWRGYIEKRALNLPPKPLRIGVVALAISVVVANFGTIAGREAGVSLLVLMTAVKLLESRTRRDIVVLVYLAYFLIATQFLFSQALGMGAYLLTTAFATTVLLVTVTRRTGDGSATPHIRTAAMLTAQALPVMVVLFLAFPRLPGPLWNMPEAEGSGRTGLDDTMSPGDISQLSQSDAVAFRVRFDGAAPPPADRYWRGLVMTGYNGRAWRRIEVPGEVPARRARGAPVGYSVTLQPHERRWLFALDSPGTPPPDAGYTRWYELVADDPVRDLRRYELTSATDYRLQPSLSTADRRFQTIVPGGAHPRTRELVSGWTDAGLADRAIVERALNWFRDRPFVYTLSPPALPGDVVDQFLFGTREGFCEHYAGAFAVMMRLAGIPARVVGGYLGAEAVAGGEYYVVRQSDAHAWVEVWLEGAGWQRVDPTSTVAPERIEVGLDAAVPDTDPVPFLARREASWLRGAALFWDRVNAEWNSLVLGYDADMQLRLLSFFSAGTLQSVATALGIGLAAVLALLAGLARWQHRAEPVPESVRWWSRACRRLARVGVARRPAEGPRDFARRVATERPADAAAFDEITRLYTALRYGDADETRHLAALKTAVARFRPRRGRAFNRRVRSRSRGLPGSP